MERDEIVKMAREAGWPITDGPFMLRFAALIEAAATEKANERANASWASMCEKMVAAEREACARVCESESEVYNNREDMEAKRCAAAIRARGS